MKFTIKLITLLSCLLLTSVTQAASLLLCKINGATYSNDSIPANEVKELKPIVLQLALKAYACARQKGMDKQRILSVIDYSLPSTEKRLWVLDLENKKVLFHTLVAHGQGSGGKFATHFSDNPGSQASSLGLFLTENTYQGHDGYSLNLRGLEPGINTHAETRRVVIHGGWYVNQQFAHEHGMIGRSWGCPALDKADNTAVINTIKNGTLLFAYYPDYHWLRNSTYLHCEM